MDILLSLAAIIFAAAIVVFFSQEFSGVIKKILAIRGATLILPIALASYIVYQFEDWLIWSLYYYREVMQQMIGFLNLVLPNVVSQILVLMLLSIGIKLALDLIASRRSYKPYVYTNITVFMTWLVSTLVLILIK